MTAHHLPNRGLRRFTRPAAGGPGGAAPAAGGPMGAGPAAVAGAGPAAQPVERCEMCGVPLDARHGHVVEVEQRSLACTCRACYLLFTQDGAAGGRYRAVPERYLRDPANRLTEAAWYELQIPVTTAFFFTNSMLGRVVACYPSPAGATECQLDLDAWERLAAAYPLLRAMAPDVEAVLVTRDGGGLAAFLVPIDACYALVGEVRLRWSGLDGGEEVRRSMDAFVANLYGRSRPLLPEA